MADLRERIQETISQVGNKGVVSVRYIKDITDAVMVLLKDYGLHECNELEHYVHGDATRCTCGTKTRPGSLARAEQRLEAGLCVACGEPVDRPTAHVRIGAPGDYDCPPVYEPPTCAECGNPIEVRNGQPPLGEHYVHADREKWDHEAHPGYVQCRACKQKLRRVPDGLVVGDVRTTRWEHAGPGETTFHITDPVHTVDTDGPPLTIDQVRAVNAWKADESTDEELAAAVAHDREVHTPCPECGDDPTADLCHKTGCWRIGTPWQMGPPWTYPTCAKCGDTLLPNLIQLRVPHADGATHRHSGYRHTHVPHDGHGPTVQDPEQTEAPKN